MESIFFGWVPVCAFLCIPRSMQAALLAAPELAEFVTPSSHAWMMVCVSKSMRHIMRAARCCVSLTLLGTGADSLLSGYLDATFPHAAALDLALVCLTRPCLLKASAQVAVMQDAQLARVRRLSLCLSQSALRHSALAVGVLKRAMLQHVSVLNLDGTPYTSDLASPHNTLVHLTEFSWAFGRLADQGAMRVVGNLLHGLERLRVLCLSHNNIEYPHNVFFAAALPALETLDLSHNRFYWNALVRFARDVRQGKMLPLLTDLDVGYSRKMLRVLVPDMCDFQARLRKEMREYVLAVSPRLARLRMAGYSPLARACFRGVSPKVCM